MRAFLLLEHDGEPVAEGVEFSNGNRYVKWLDEDTVHVHWAPVDEQRFPGGWEFVWVTDVITGAPEGHVPRMQRG
jgi:hypothetical protein